MLSGVAIKRRLVRVYVLLDPIEGRQNGAWVIQYRRQAFMIDKGGGNQEPFVWGSQSMQVVESRAEAKPPLMGFDVKTREDIARELRINPALLDFVQRGDDTFPEPIVTFREGPLWDAEAIERWAPTRRPPAARDRSLLLP
jgi:hypothetical protein